MRKRELKLSSKGPWIWFLWPLCDFSKKGLCKELPRLHPSSIWCQGSNPRPLDCEPSALTNRPRLSPNLNTSLLLQYLNFYLKCILTCNILHTTLVLGFILHEIKCIINISLIRKCIGSIWILFRSKISKRCIVSLVSISNWSERGKNVIWK